jgi:hypothetical protein
MCSPSKEITLGPSKKTSNPRLVGNEAFTGFVPSYGFLERNRLISPALLEANAEMNFRNGCSACQPFPQAILSESPGRRPFGEFFRRLL